MEDVRRKRATVGIPCNEEPRCLAVQSFRFHLVISPRIHNHSLKVDCHDDDDDKDEEDEETRGTAE